MGTKCRYPGCPVEIEFYFDKPGPAGKPPLILAVGTGKPHYHSKWETEQQRKDRDFARQIEHSESIWNPNLYRKYGSEWGCKFCSKHGDRFYMHNHQCHHNRNKPDDPFWKERRKVALVNMKDDLPRGQATLF